MAITHAPTVRTSFAQEVLDSIGSGGSLVILDNATVLTEHTLGTPAGVVNGAMLTFHTIENAVAQAAGTPTRFEIRDSGGAVVLEGSVGGTGSNADLVFNTTGWVVGGTVEIDSAVYNAAP